MRTIVLSIIVGALSFLLALPPAYLLGDLRITHAATWAGVAAIVAALSFLFWRFRNPGQRLSNRRAMAFALTAFFATVLAFVLDASQPWEWRIFFVAWSAVFVSWYALIAGLLTGFLVQRIEGRHAV